MMVLLFGVSNVGKTSIGEVLAKKLNYKFLDLDDEVKVYYNTTLEEFVNTGSLHTRDRKRGEVIKYLVNSNKDNIVIAITPIYHSINFNYLLKIENIIAIELQDTPINIFNRLVFSDENDVIYTDDEYKKEHMDYYISDIKKDITCYKRSFEKISNKFFIDGMNISDTVEKIYNKYLK